MRFSLLSCSLLTYALRRVVAVRRTRRLMLSLICPPEHHGRRIPDGHDTRVCMIHRRTRQAFAVFSACAEIAATHLQAKIKASLLWNLGRSHLKKSKKKNMTPLEGILFKLIRRRAEANHSPGSATRSPIAFPSRTLGRPYSNDYVSQR